MVAPTASGTSNNGAVSQVPGLHAVPMAEVLGPLQSELCHLLWARELCLTMLIQVSFLRLDRLPALLPPLLAPRGGMLLWTMNSMSISLASRLWIPDWILFWTPETGGWQGTNTCLTLVGRLNLGPESPTLTHSALENQAWLTQIVQHSD